MNITARLAKLEQQQDEGIHFVWQNEGEDREAAWDRHIRRRGFTPEAAARIRDFGRVTFWSWLPAQTAGGDE